MRRQWAWLVALLLLVPRADRSFAQSNQALGLSWGNQCAPVISDANPAAGESVTITAFVERHLVPHHGYQVHVVLGRGDGTVPDAWRFDAKGCNGGVAVAILSTPSAALAKSCPPFHQGTAGFVVSGTAYEKHEQRGHHQFILRAFLGVSYPVELVPNPDQRYFLAQFNFDHLNSVTGPTTPGVTCGGLEESLCIAVDLEEGIWGLPYSGYVSGPDDLYQRFNPSQSGWLTVRGDAGCPSTPVPASTWGGIKSQYRR